MRGEFSVATLEPGMIVNETDSANIPIPTGPMRTYLFRPAAEWRYPGLVLYSEIFQATGPIRRTAVMLANHGFVVAVPEHGNRCKTAKILSSYDGDARAVLPEILLALHE